jgi:hypothetical protein
MAPVWMTIHLPLAILWLAALAVRWTLLFRPGLRRLRVAFDIAANLVGLVVAVILLKADAIVRLVPGADAGAHAADLPALVHVIDMSFRIAIVVWICAALWDLVKGAMRRYDA